MSLSRDKNALNKLKTIIIAGPTASGKTGLSLALAKKFNGEIISADSRQVYRGMDIGTAKVKSQRLKVKTSSECKCTHFAEGILHHLIDIVNPDELFTVADFKQRAEKCMADSIKRGKIPFIVGGTGLYVKALLKNLDFAEVEPDKKLRAELESKPLEELVKILAQYDPERVKTIDIKNKRRVIRAVEIACSTADRDTIHRVLAKSEEYNFLQIGIKIPQHELYRRIDKRIDEQIREGLVGEVRKLSEKYSWELPSMSGIGYRQIGYYLRGEMSLEEAIARLKFDTHHYAKRQMTWFKRDISIMWLEGSDISTTAEALVKRFLEK